jgi:hypothetical protein
MAIGAEDLVLVDLAPPDAGDEDLPDAGGTAPPHGVAPPVPSVEVPHDRNAPRIWRPDGEGGARDALVLHRVRAEAAVELLVPALAEEVFVHLAQHRPEGVGVAKLPFVPGRVSQPEAIGLPLLAPLEAAVEEAFGVDPLQIAERLALEVHDRHLRRIGREDIDGDGPAVFLVHAEHVEGVAVLAAQDRLDLGGRGCRVGKGVRGHRASSSIRDRRPRSGRSTHSGRIAIS